jgi:hypothetical protein
MASNLLVVGGDTGAGAARTGNHLLAAVSSDLPLDVPLGACPDGASV